MVPDVPITRSKPAATICSQCRSISPSTWFDDFPFLTSGQRVAVNEPLGEADGADLETPGELDVRCGAEVISTLPPPMSMTTARPPPTSTP
jgi:hypothetical protein